MVDSSIKWPINYSTNRFASQRSNDFQTNMSKGIPCHVTKIDKDMVTVAFDTKNNVWTVPTMKMPQAFSGYARDATQVGDHGYACPSDYYLGGNSGLGGGIANYAPRGNLTALAFHPMSRTANQTRDYDKYTVTGGKNGVQFWQGPVPSQQQQTTPGATGTTPAASSGASPSTSATATLARAYPRGRRSASSHYVHGRGFYAAPRATPQATANGSTSTGNGSTSSSDGSASQGSQGQLSGTSFTIDNKGVYTLDGTQKYRMTVQQSSQKTTVEAPVAGKIYIGGPGAKPELYLPLMTIQGPVVNAMGKVKPTDEDVPSMQPGGSSGSSS
jgi:hypothetical protein